MDSGKIHWRWSRPLRNINKKKRKTGLMNYAKRKNKEIVLKVEPEESLTASGFDSELNSENTPAHNNDTNSMEISSSIEKPINVNEEIANNNSIVKEEIEIKDEVYDQSMFDANEPNITPDLSSESNSRFNVDHSNATSEFDNIRIGIDESLIGRHVKGVFSSETIGSKTLIVFRRLPGEPEIIVPTNVNEKKSVPSKKGKENTSYKNSFSSKKIRFLCEQKKAIINGKYTRFCSKCKIPLELDSTENCTLCAANSLFGCKHCNDTFDSYFTLSHHILMRCIPQGYYYCPQCFYKSRCFNVVRKHVLLMHPHLGLDFDLQSIQWKDIARDENGAALLMHVCQNCNKVFQRLPNYNLHTGICHKIRPGLKSISMNNDSSSREDENSFSQENSIDDGRKKIMLHCEKCNRDIKFHHSLNCQPNCTSCQSKMKFRCTYCNKLMDKDSWAVKHLQSTCTREKLECRFCGKNVLYKRNLFRHERSHTANHQIESPSQNISQDEAVKFPDSSENEMNSNKGTMSTCEEEKKSAKFLSNPDSTKQSIDPQRQSHPKMSKRQVVESPLKKNSLDQAKIFSENRKNETNPSKKNTKSSREKEKRSTKCFSSQKSNAKFSRNFNLTGQPKYCEKKLQMQCKVLLTRLRINNNKS